MHAHMMTSRTMCAVDVASAVDCRRTCVFSEKDRRGEEEERLPSPDIDGIDVDSVDDDDD